MFVLYGPFVSTHWEIHSFTFASGFLKHKYSYCGQPFKWSGTCNLSSWLTSLFQEYKSTETRIVLRNVDLTTSGKFRCEVSGEAPLFQTATHTNVLIVVGELTLMHKRSSSYIVWSSLYSVLRRSWHHKTLSWCRQKMCIEEAKKISHSWQWQAKLHVEKWGQLPPCVSLDGRESRRLLTDLGCPNCLGKYSPSHVILHNFIV